MDKSLNYMEVFKYLIGKRIYVELNGGISCIADIGIVENIDEDFLQIDIIGENDDFTIFKDSGYKIDRINDLTEDDEEDKFLFRVTFTFSTISAYFFEYEEDNE